MTYIAKSAIPDIEVLNHVSRDLLVSTEDPNRTMMRRYFRVVTEDGVVHDLTFQQLDGLINILDLHREMSTITPLQYLVNSYDLKDMIELGKDGWGVESYTIVVMHNAKAVRFEGTLIKESFTDKIFSFALGDFDFVQQFTLSRIISQQAEALAPTAGTFDFSYSFEYSPKGLSFKALEEGSKLED